MKGRLVAVVVAAALVVGAFVVRQEVIEGDDGAGEASPGELVCLTELADVCDAVADDTSLTVTIEDAGDTLDRLAALADDGEPPLWLTVEPFPAMADVLRTAARADPLGYDDSVLGTSQLAVALPPDGRLDTLAAACATDRLWRCIGDHAGAPWSDLGGEPGWGTVRPALGDVDDSALGLASFAASVAGFLGDADVSRSRWEADASFTPWLRGLARRASAVSLSGGTALGTMATRPSALDVAATAGFELAELDATAERFAPSYPAPEMWLQAVLAVPGGAAAPGDLASGLAEQLRDAGWDDAAAATATLPGAATMLALRTLWQDAA